ncbi:MAG: toll/interleukin-1 receptor domain-containing protein [Candidatus Tenebribacter davisii]|nr:toll/interleukin-1 receptor domain-containing protein [Candidatus Tenebribacter davisii]
MPKAINIFVCYAHKNKSWVDDKDEFNLVPYLADSLKYHQITTWYDDDLKTLPGIDYQKKIINEINKADIALLLLSQDFLSSNFINNIELPEIKKRNEQGNLEIVSILVEPWFITDMHPAAWLDKRQIIPGSPTALSEYTDSKRNFLKARITILASMERMIQTIKVKRSSPNVDNKPEKQNNINTLKLSKKKSKLSSYLQKIFKKDKKNEGENQLEKEKQELINTKAMNKLQENLVENTKSSNNEIERKNESDLFDTNKEVVEKDPVKTLKNINEVNKTKNKSKGPQDVLGDTTKIEKQNIPVTKSDYRVNVRIGNISILNFTEYAPMQEQVRIGKIEIVKQEKN